MASRTARRTGTGSEMSVGLAPVQSALALIRSIAAIDVQDGLVFTPDWARAGVIRVRSTTRAYA